MKFEINDKVKLIAPVSYLKTSDNMPMLRPPDLVAIDEVGEILSIKTPETVEVKFRRGSFLIDVDKIEKNLLKSFFSIFLKFLGIYFYFQKYSEKVLKNTYWLI